MKTWPLTALAFCCATMMTACGGGGNDSSDNTVPPPAPPAADNSVAAAQPQFGYAGNWKDHNETCEREGNAYSIDVDVITETATGRYQKQEQDWFFENNTCSGAPVRTVTKSVEYLKVISHARLTDGTAVDQIYESAQENGAVTEKCVAFVRNNQLFKECNDANEAFPTRIDLNEWDVPVEATAPDNTGGAAGTPVQPLFSYAGTWRDNDETCDTSGAAYELDVEVITALGVGQFRHQDQSWTFSNASCSGTPMRTRDKETVFLTVVGQTRLADGTQADVMNQTTAQQGGALVGKCVAFIRNNQMFAECANANENYPTSVDQTDWEIRVQQ